MQSSQWLEVMRNQLIETYPDETFLLADGFDDAIIGVDSHSRRVIYSISKCIDILVSEGLDHEDAIDHFFFNTHGAYVGENTPIWCEDIQP